MFFGSDNQSGASQRVLDAVAEANRGYAHGYGDDPWTARATQALRDTFQCELDAYFVTTGTAANSLALACAVHPWQTILCHDQSHIINDESTAPELFTGGARLIGISQGDDKLTALRLAEFLGRAGNDIPHHAKGGAVSITQIAENGLVYSPEEIKALAHVARQHHLVVQMDGARFANAVAALDCAPADVTWKAGVDVLCLGATKNGALAAESVIFFNRELANNFIHRRKRAGHLVSKSRFIGAQFAAWLQDDHWLQLARHANAQANKLAKRLTIYPAVRFVWPANANELFVIMPKALANHLRSRGAEFYEWSVTALPSAAHIGSDETLARLVTSHITQDRDIDNFCAAIECYAS